MKTKRMKKLLMGMGLSRNQVNHMVKEQRLKGSSKLSNAAYYYAVNRSLSKPCWRDWLPYAFAVNQLYNQQNRAKIQRYRDK